MKFEIEVSESDLDAGCEVIFDWLEDAMLHLYNDISESFKATHLADVHRVAIDDDFRKCMEVMREINRKNPRTFRFAYVRDRLPNNLWLRILDEMVYDEFEPDTHEVPDHIKEEFRDAIEKKKAGIDRM